MGENSKNWIATCAGPYFVCRAQGVSDYFAQLPGVDNPEIFGMHENANVTFNTNESLGLMQTVSCRLYQRRYMSPV